MKEAIQQYIEELYNKVKDFKHQYSGQYAELINVTLKVIERLESIIANEEGEFFYIEGEDKKPLIKNSSIDTEENKSENWRLTKYPT